MDAESSKLQAAVAYFPNSDLVNYGGKDKPIYQHFQERGLKAGFVSAFRRWDEDTGLFVPMNEEQRHAVLVQCSPLLHVSSDAPPTLLFHGDEDQLVPIQQSRVFEKRMTEVGATCRLIVAEHKGHSWDERLPNELEEFLGWFDRYLRKPEP